MDLSSKKISNMVNRQNTANQGKRTIGKRNLPGDKAGTKHLAEGEIIKGEITDLRNNQVTILLDENTEVKARLDNVNWLSIGDIGSFRVMSSDSNSIKLQAIPMSDSEIENNTMFKALEEAGLPHNSRNQTIVLSLIRNQMPITKASILDILKQSYEYEDSSIRTIVLLNKYHIPATMENARQLENYMTDNHSLHSEIANCMESIPSMLRELALYSDNLNETGKQFFELLQLNTEQSAPTQSAESYYDFSSTKVKNELISILSDFGLSEEIKDAILNNKITLTALQGAIQEAMENAGQIDRRNQELVLADLSPEELANQQLVDQLLEDVPKTMDAFEHSEIANIKDAFLAHQKNNLMTEGFFGDTARELFAKFLEQNPNNLTLASQVRNGTRTLNELLLGIQGTIPNASEESLQQLFTSPEFVTLVREEFKKQWNLSLTDASSKQKISAFYSKLYGQTKGLEQLLESVHPEFNESSMENNLAAVKGNINFMQMLNNIFPYIQLPFLTETSSGNGELYVYTKKDELKKNPHQITVLLHLDLEHLGLLDIHITKKDFTLENKFYIKDDFSKRLLKKNISLLSEKLSDMGYSVTNEFMKSEWKTDLANDFLKEQTQASTSIKRYTFDVRA